MQTLFSRYRVWLLHFSFWCVYLSFFLYQISYFQQGPDYNWNKALVFGGSQLAFTMLIAYLNYFVFLPRWLVHKNLGRYLIELLIPFGILVTIRIHVQRYLADGYTYQENYF